MKRILRTQPAVQLLASRPPARLSAPFTCHIASRPAPRIGCPHASQARFFSDSRRLSEDTKKEDADDAKAEYTKSEADATYANPIDGLLDDALANDSSSKDAEETSSDQTATETTAEATTDTATETAEATTGSATETVSSATTPNDEPTYTMTKIPADESTAYSDKRSDMFTKTRPPSKVVSVMPNAEENEKFNFPLLRRPRRIVNKEAIISGGASGIGFAIAQRLAAEGVQCTLVGRTEDRLRKAAETLPPLFLSGANMSETDLLVKQHKYFVADICDPKAWRDLFQQSPNANYLINAAGITYRSLLAIFPADEIQRIYDVNLYGTTIGCRAALRSWARSHKAHGLPSERPDRCIVNVSSALATQGGYGAAAYAASKAGVVALTRSLAQEATTRNVRCNVILPGYIQTRMTESLLSQETIRKIAVKRLGRPDEVADAVTFLIKNKYANNCTLNLDGGLF